MFVALADNIHQGVIPVPDALGNGDDPARNLYWGAAFGVKTFFSRSDNWKLLTMQTKPAVLERCIFKNRHAEVYLVGDAYQGTQIREAIADFLEAAAGASAETIPVKTAAPCNSPEGPVWWFT